MGRFNATPPDFMLAVRIRLPFAIVLSLGVHAGLVLWAAQMPPPPPSPAPEPLQVNLTLAPEPEIKPVRPAKPTPPSLEKKNRVRMPDAPSSPAPEKILSTLAAPSAPTAEDWQLASTYTLKNSKRYRYNWGQQVRSMMGTAVEGVRQGLVRVRVEIAPDGKLAKVEVLWSTSEIAEKLALQAIRSMPPLPPTPTGKPLVFEKTISLMPFETGWPPSYKLDCLPDVQAFNNPFAWNGASQGPVASAPRPHRPPPPDDCITDSTAETIEQEEAEMKRQMDQWRWGR